MEAKLSEYRARKQREEFVAKVKGRVNNFVTSSTNGFGTWLRNRTSRDTTDGNENHRNLDIEPLLNEDGEHMEHEEDVEGVPVLSDEEIDKINCFTYKQFFKYLGIFIMWATVYYIFILWGFGSVYFLLSCIIGMYLNTRTDKKKRNEVSAYSVFNKNCESIKGTVKAEDLERQMVFGNIF